NDSPSSLVVSDNSFVFCLCSSVALPESSVALLNTVIAVTTAAIPTANQPAGPRNALRVTKATRKLANDGINLPITGSNLPNENPATLIPVANTPSTVTVLTNADAVVLIGLANSLNFSTIVSTASTTFSAMEIITFNVGMN